MTRLFLALASLAAATAARADDAPKTFFLGVAVSRYPNFERFRPLDRAAADVARLSEKLRGPEKTAHYYHLMQDGSVNAHDPSSANVRIILVEFARLVRPQDRVVVVLRGHGFENEKGAVFCTSDSSLTDPASMMYVEEVVLRVKALPAKQKLVVVDACRDFKDGIPVADLPEDIRPIPSRSRPAPAVDATLCVIQSCSSGQFSFNRPDTAGVMSQFFLKALGGEPEADTDRDGRVSTGEAIQYVHRHVRAEARKVHGQRQDLDARDETADESFALATVAPGAVAAAPSQVADTPQPVLTFGAPPIPGSFDRVSNGRSETTTGYAPGVFGGFAGNGVAGDGRILSALANPNVAIPTQFGNLPIPVQNPIPSQVRTYLGAAGGYLGAAGGFFR